MSAENVERWTTDRGPVSSGVVAVMSLVISGVMSFAQHAAAKPHREVAAATTEPPPPSSPATTPATTPDPPPRRRAPPMCGTSRLASTASLDGIYVWLGPLGAASRAEADWDSTFGADLSVLRVREDAALGVVGASAGASRWSERGGGRLWLDGVVGTELGGRMYGATAGPIVELSELAHPRVGGSIGVWAFFGVTPFARVGAVGELGTFVEVGLHLALPVYRHR